MKTAVVTGASRGIGRAICVELAKNNIDVVINYQGNEQAANQTKQMCEEYGVKAYCVKADVSNSEQAQQLISTALENLGSIDILVNNAGITKDNLVMRMSEQDFDSVIDTNLKGAFYCTKAVTRLMMKQRKGRIINVSSVVALSGNAGQVNYTASKAGVIGMTKSLARELASRNITVNAVAPGFIETDMTDVLSQEVKTQLSTQIPLARFGTPQDIADAIMFLASEKAGYITGQVLSVNGGMYM